MPESDSTVLFRALPVDQKISLEEKRAIRSFAQTLRRQVTAGRRFVAVIAGDSELRRLNKAFLDHDYATDVLSFPSQSDDEEVGELIISAERAQAQAQRLGHDRITEICTLMLHGILHLCGMDHEQDRGEMETAEQKWRQEFGLPPGLIARTRRVGVVAATRPRRAG